MMKDSLLVRWVSWQRRQNTPSGQWAWVFIYAACGLLTLLIGYVRTGQSSHFLASMLFFLIAVFSLVELGWNKLVDQKDKEIEELKKKLGS